MILPGVPNMLKWILDFLFPASCDDSSYTSTHEKHGSWFWDWSDIVCKAYIVQVLIWRFGEALARLINAKIEFS